MSELTPTVFVMTDVVGSTALWERHGPAMDDALLLHDRIVHGTMKASGGRVFKHTGDGMIAAFSEADAAAQAALRSTAELASARWGATGELSVRVSVHAGRAVERGDDFFGNPVNQVARINGVGHGGQILASDASLRLMTAPNATDLGHHQLKDLAEPMHLWQLDSGGHPPLRSLVVARHNLPRQLTDFLGRANEVVEVAGLLSSGPLVTITGMGGCGKTRLALEVAATVAPRFSGGTWFADLTPIRHPDQIGAVIIEALGLPVQARAAIDDVVRALDEAVGADPTLLIIDNCEHLVVDVGDFIGQLLASLPTVTVLATSREALSIPGERAWRIPSLDSASVELFLNRASATGGRDFELSTERVAEICAALDHIPLAVELAAAQTSFLSLDELASRLDDRFVVLGSAGATRRTRQQTLQAMMEWSFDLLDEDELSLLCNLSIFMGSFSLGGAAAVCAESKRPVLDVMRSLVAQSLVIPLGEDGRYRLMETVRMFAFDLLSLGGQVSLARDRHLEWVRSFCGFDATAGLTWAEYVAINIRQLSESTSYFEALDWADFNGDTTSLTDLLYGGWGVFLVERPQYGIELISRVERPHSDDHGRFLQHLGCEAYTHFGVGNYSAALAAAHECFDVVLGFGPAGSQQLPATTASVIEIYGYLAMVDGDVDGAHAAMRYLADLAATEEGIGAGEVSLHTLSADVRFIQGDAAAAAEAVERMRANIDVTTAWSIGLMWFFTARVALARSDFALALQAAEDAKRHRNIAEVKSQIPELTGLALTGLGQLAKAVETHRADPGPQFDLHRQYHQEGQIAGLLALWTALGAEVEAHGWARALRDLSSTVSAPYRTAWLERVVGGPTALAELAPSDLVGLSRAEIDDIIALSFDDVERRLAQTTEQEGQ